MAVVETIRIDGDSQQFEAAVNDLNNSVRDLNKNIKNFGNTADKSFDKAEKAVEGVKQEVKETGKSLKDLVQNLGGLAILTSVADKAKETFTANQRVADVLNQAMFSLQIGISGVIEAFATGNLGSIPSLLANANREAAELVLLQKEAQRAEVKRVELQFTYQKLAEEQRQIRDEERNALDDRIIANENLNAVLVEQLDRERETVQIKIAQAKAEYQRLPNIENEIALRQANVELLDIEERIIGQRSEYLSNNLALERERRDLEQQILDLQAQQIESGNRFNAETLETFVDVYDTRVMNEKSLLDLEFERYDKARMIRDNFLVDQIRAAQEAGQTENAMYQDLLNQRTELDIEYQERYKDYVQQRQELNRQSVTDAVGSSIQALETISKFVEVSQDADEASKERAFKIQKQLSTAQAVVQGIEAVQNAYSTAQKSPLTALAPNYPYIAAGLAAAFTAAQVASIQRSTFSSGSQSITTPSTTAPSQPAQFNIVGQSGTNQLVEGLAGQFDKPIRAYVVSGEVISGSELDRRRLRTATFP
jgi:hypothetical protein